MGFTWRAVAGRIRPWLKWSARSRQTLLLFSPISSTFYHPGSQHLQQFVEFFVSILKTTTCGMKLAGFLLIGLIAVLIAVDCDASCESGVMYSDALDCTKFFECSNSELVHKSCGPGTYFDDETRVCSWSWQLSKRRRDFCGL
jgi:hypothetical protein